MVGGMTGCGVEMLFWLVKNEKNKQVGELVRKALEKVEGTRRF